MYGDTHIYRVTWAFVLFLLLTTAYVTLGTPVNLFDFFGFCDGYYQLETPRELSSGHTLAGSSELPSRG